MGYEVIKFPEKISGDFLENYKKEFTDHYQSIAKADIVLALNPEKKGIQGYIGAGVFAEIAYSIGLKRVDQKEIEIFYAYQISTGELPYADELKLWMELGWIKPFPS